MVDIARITREDCLPYLNTKFKVSAGTFGPVELELIDVRGGETTPDSPPGQYRFSIFFLGPDTVPMPQYTYLFEHEQMGSFQLFIVPVGIEEGGRLYEAVFNRRQR